MEYGNKLYQIKDKVNTRKIVIEERLNGSKIMLCKNRVLKFKEIPLKVKKQQPSLCSTNKKRKRYIPPADHPWRNVSYG